jgi:hypothetical protein
MEALANNSEHSTNEKTPNKKGCLFKMMTILDRTNSNNDSQDEDQDEVRALSNSPERDIDYSDSFALYIFLVNVYYRLRLN